MDPFMDVYYYYYYYYCLWKLSAYVFQIEISENLNCLMLSVNVENVLPLDSLLRHMPSQCYCYIQWKFGLN